MFILIFIRKDFRATLGVQNRIQNYVYGELLASGTIHVLFRSTLCFVVAFFNNNYLLILERISSISQSRKVNHGNRIIELRICPTVLWF